MTNEPELSDLIWHVKYGKINPNLFFNLYKILNPENTPISLGENRYLVEMVDGRETLVQVVKFEEAE